MNVIEDLSFSVRAGSRTALIGPNGAGKTTVFNLITGVYPVDAGRIYAGETDITRVAVARAHSPWHRPHIPERAADAASDDA